jgi:hypothetical protein
MVRSDGKWVSENNMVKVLDVERLPAQGKFFIRVLFSIKSN